MNECEQALVLLQTWVVNHHPGYFDVSTPRNIARVMIALTHEAPVEGESYEPPELLAVGAARAGPPEGQ
jgi:hypothetical protein